MPGNAAEPAPSEGSKTAARDRNGQGGEGGAGDERYGQLRVARHAKDDGRELILYRQGEEQP